MPRPLLIALCVAVTAAGASARQSQTAPVVFRASVNYVEVDATVTDSRGRAVPDLAAGDFEVFEDGQAQTIASFARVDLPAQRATSAPLVATPPIQSDVRTNAPIEGGIYLIVLDDLHTDFARTPRVKDIVRQFIERAVGPDDVAAVVYTGHNDAMQDFTGNRQLLFAAVDKFVGVKLRSATILQLEGQRTVPDPGLATSHLELGADVLKDVRAYRARSVMESIRQLSEFMASIHGRRKAMVLFGEGIDYDVDQTLGAGGSAASLVVEDTRKAIAASQRGNVTIYSVDPRGLFDSTDALVQSAAQFNRDAPESQQPAATRFAAINNRGIGRQPPPPDANVATLQNEVRLQQESLRAVARETGGFPILNTNDFLRAFDRIVRENSNYYLLGYYPANDKRDGTLRKLQVRVRRPGLTVHARKSYVASGASTPASATTGAPLSPILEALGSPLPVSGIPMRVSAAPFRGPLDRASVRVAIDLDASRFGFVREGPAWVESLEVAMEAVAGGGGLQPGNHQKMALTLTPSTHEAVIARGLRVLGQTDLPPGRYQLRVAVSTGSGKTGSTVYDLDVPDYTKASLTMSGLVLSSLDSSKTPTLSLDGGPSLPGPPTTARTFAQSDQVTVFGEIYDNARSETAHTVTITTSLRNPAGVALRTTVDERSSLELGDGPRAYRFIAGMPLDDLTPGAYIIHVEARGDFGDRPAAARDIHIIVTAP